MEQVRQENTAEPIMKQLAIIPAPEYCQAPITINSFLVIRPSSYKPLVKTAPASVDCRSVINAKPVKPGKPSKGFNNGVKHFCAARIAPQWSRTSIIPIANITPGTKDSANIKPPRAPKPPLPTKVDLPSSFITPNLPTKVVKSNALNHFISGNLTITPEKNKIATTKAKKANGPAFH